jgi:uncharacterized damage-inducible protein DinB
MDSLSVNSLTVVRRMHEHRIWADHQLVHAAVSLTDEQLHHDLPIGQGSVWKSLCHMWAAEHVWLDAVHGIEAAVAPGDDPRKLPGNQLAADGMRTMSELETRWERLHARWANYLAKLSADNLVRDVWRSSPMIDPPKRLKTALLDVLLHVCMHAHWTAAQTVNMLRTVGAETPLPNVMHISLARQQLGQ